MGHYDSLFSSFNILKNTEVKTVVVKTRHQERDRVESYD